MPQNVPPGQAPAGSIFATPGESGYTYEEEQIALAWAADPKPENLRKVEAKIGRKDREVELLQWANAEHVKRQRPDGGVEHGPNPDNGGPGRGKGRNP